MTVLTPVAKQTPWDTNIVVEVSSAAPMADPVWVDISAWVMVPQGVTLDTWVGRATELDTSEPGRFSLVLNNRDSRFTPGNTLSPYYPWWKQARRLRIREIVTWRAFTLADGFLQVPDNLIFTEVVGESDSDITLAVTGLDLLGRAATGRKFISNLAAHILASDAASSLLGYYSMLDPPGSKGVRPTYTANGQSFPVLGLVKFDEGANGGGIAFASGEPMPGDDQPGPQSTFVEDVSAGVSSSTALMGSAQPGTNLISPAISVPSGDVLTVAMWLNVRGPDVGGLGPVVFYLYNNDVPALLLLTYDPGIPRSWRVILDYDSGTWGSYIETGMTIEQTPMLVAVRISPGGTSEVWMNKNRVTLTIPGVPPATMVFSEVRQVLGSTQGTGDHLQFYVHGPADGYTWETHVAQLEMGYRGLERQTTGERINTIADFYGLPAAARDIDEGVALMSKVTLAGRTAADAWQEANETERGRLTTNAGRLVFHDRRHVYDV